MGTPADPRRRRRPAPRTGHHRSGDVLRRQRRHADRSRSQSDGGCSRAIGRARDARPRAESTTEQYGGVCVGLDGRVSGFVPRGSAAPSHHFIGVVQIVAEALRSIAPGTPTLSILSGLYDALIQHDPRAVFGYVCQSALGNGHAGRLLGHVHVIRRCGRSAPKPSAVETWHQRVGPRHSIDPGGTISKWAQARRSMNASSRTASPCPRAPPIAARFSCGPGEVNH